MARQRAEVRAGLGLAIALAAAACNANEPVYFAPRGPAIAGDPGATGTGGAYGGGNLATQVVTLPFRAPDQDERARLRDEAQRLELPRVAWLRRSDVRLSLDYTITNLDRAPGVAQVLVNGANEVTRYDVEAILAAYAMAGTREEDQIVLSLFSGKPIEIPAGATVSGSVREDDFDEMALDLFALGMFNEEYAALLINHSHVNPKGLEMVPRQAPVPALYEIVVTLVANRTMEINFLVRVRDQGNRLRSGDQPLFAPEPMTFVPPIAP